MKTIYTAAVFNKDPNSIMYVIEIPFETSESALKHLDENYPNKAFVVNKNRVDSSGKTVKSGVIARFNSTTIPQTN